MIFTIINLKVKKNSISTMHGGLSFHFQLAFFSYHLIYKVIIFDTCLVLPYT